MKLLFNFIVGTLFLLNFSILHANDKIVYIDLDLVMTNSIVGKELITSIEKKSIKVSKEFELRATKLKEEEIQIVSQKNILKEEDYEKKVNEFSIKIENFKKEKTKAIDQLNNDRIKTTQLLLEKIKPILADYSEENKISLVLQKQNVIIGKTDLDITEQILLIVNEKIKEIE